MMGFDVGGDLLDCIDNLSMRKESVQLVNVYYIEALRYIAHLSCMLSSGSSTSESRCEFAWVVKKHATAVKCIMTKRPQKPTSDKRNIWQ